jgi:hypothetical protein
MRLIKNKKEGDNLFEITEIQWIKQRKHNKKNLIQYCDLPEVKNLKPFTKYKKLHLINWETDEIDMRLVCKPKQALWKITQELIIQSEIQDNKNWKNKRKNNLVAYILELAYNLGLLNSHSNLAKNENSRKNKQEKSKDVNPDGDKTARKKKETPEPTKSNRRRRVTRRSETTQKTSAGE